jgi:hypothetical protein
MKRIVLIVCLLFFVAFVSNVYAARGDSVVCLSSDPAKILVKSYLFKNEEFFFEFSNYTDGTIEIASIEIFEANFRIMNPPKGVFALGEKIRIKGNYPEEVLNIDGKILIAYTDLGGSEKNATITCTGPPTISNPTYDLIMSFFQILPYLLLILGVLSIVFGYLKKRGLLAIIGLVLIVIALLLLAGFPWILY